MLGKMSNSFLKSGVYVYVGLGVCTLVQVITGLRRGIEPLGAGVVGACES